MSTNGTLGFRVGGVDKIAYNHNDSYPGWLGVETLKQTKALLKKFGFDKLVELAEAIQVVDPDSVPTEEQIKRCASFANTWVNEGRLDSWYCLLREAQGYLEPYLSVGIMPDNSVFMRTSLFCEWAYVVNLDSMEFEVYQGFQKSPGRGRFANLPVEDDASYYPVSLVASYPLTKLPTANRFLNDMEALQSPFWDDNSNKVAVQLFEKCIANRDAQAALAARKWVLGNWSDEADDLATLKALERAALIATTESTRIPTQTQLRKAYEQAGISV